MKRGHKKIGKAWALLLICLFVFSALLLNACESSKPTMTSGGKGKILVTTTTGMVADIVKNVGGEHVQVEGLMGPGVDPHLYKASQGDIRKLDQADMIFYNGLYLEGKMTDIFNKISKQKPVIAVAEKIDKSKLIKTGPNEYDPHIWFDVSLWTKAVKRTEEALIEADPDHESDYRKNSEKYLAQLHELDQNIKKEIVSIPKKRRVLVTAHDAFGYFGRAYDIEVVGLQGISTASEYGLKDVQRIVDLLAERKIKAVFIESSVPKRSIEAVVKGTAKKGHNIKIGGELFSDALGEKGTPEGNYIGMVRYNVNTIVNALN